MKDKIALKKDNKMAARRAKEHKIPIMKVGKSKRPACKKDEEPRRKRGRPRGGEPPAKKPAPKKNEGARKRKSEAKPAPLLKKPKMMNGDVHKPFSQRGVENCATSNGTLHSTNKKTLLFNPKKNSISILKSATFHPPVSLTAKRELLNGSSSLPPFKPLPSKNKSSFKKDANSLCKESGTGSKVGKVNNVSPLTVSHELGRNLAKDIVKFCSKEPSKSKDAAKLPPKETTAKYQSKESPKSTLKIHPKETSKPHSGKPQAKDSSKSLQQKEPAKPLAKDGSKSLQQKEPVKPLAKDSAKPKDRPATKEPSSKSQPSKPKETVKSQTKEWVQFVPVKSHPQRMASLDAMARMHVICTTDRKPPEPRHGSACPRPVTKSITQCHERIQFDLKKETNDIKGNIVHKQEINYVKEKQQVFVSHSVEQSSIVEQSKTVSTQQEKKKKKPADNNKSVGRKLVKAKLKPVPSSHPKPIGVPKSEKGKDGSQKKKEDIIKKTKKKVETKSEVKVKETIRMQKTCTYQSVTHTVNSSADSIVPVGSMTTNFKKTSVVTADEECKNHFPENSSYCLTTTSESGCRFHHPQVIPLAHVRACSPSSPTSFSVHRFSPPSIIFAPAAPDCGCCLVADSCLLRKSLVAYPHLPSHHAHHLSAPAFSTETVCSDCHPSNHTSCCHHHHHHHGGLHHYLSPAPSSPSLVPYAEPSPLDLSLAHRQRISSPCCSSSRPELQQQLLLIRPHHRPACCRCKEADLTSCSSPGPARPVASTSGGAADAPAKREEGRVFGHGWRWKGKPRERLVALTNDSLPCPRTCYPGVEHEEGDTISERDCVLLRSGPKDTDLPYVAKVAAFWENPDDGEMMMSLLWYYRPEHTDQGRRTGQMEDEVFASRHKDVNSVACIEDKCYVLTYNEYCRYKASLIMDEETVSVSSLVVPELPEGIYLRKGRLPCEPVSQDIVFFCRHVYDFRQKRILKNPT